MSTKQDNADVNATTNRDFYPEDAQERNFEEARRLAQENHEKSLETVDNPAVADYLEATTELSAKPEVSADTNPEQVKTDEDGDSSVKAPVVDDVQKANEDSAKEDAAQAVKTQKASETTTSSKDK